MPRLTGGSQRFPPRHPAGTPSEPRGSSIPKLLLGLGALCLLVAALVFLAVTWSALGLGGRTAILGLLTAVAAALAWFSARRGLRGGLESLGVVALGLLSLDVMGALRAGWFGEVGLDTAVAASGLTVCVAALLAAVPIAATPARRFYGGQLMILPAGLTALAALYVAVTPDLYATVPFTPSVLIFLGYSALTTAGWRLHRLTDGLRPALWVLLFIAALSWVGALSSALDQVGDEVTVRTMLLSADGWRLLLVAALAAAWASARPLWIWARVLASSAAAGTVGLAVTLPADAAEGDQPLLLTGVVLAVLLAVALLTVPRPWVFAAVPLAAIAAGATASGLGLVAAFSLETYASAGVTPWQGGIASGVTTARADAASLPGSNGVAGWTAILTATTLVLLVLAVLRRLHTALPELPRPSDRVSAGSILTAAAAGGYASLLTVATPLWLAVALPILAATALFEVGRRHGSTGAGRWVGSGDVDRTSPARDVLLPLLSLLTLILLIVAVPLAQHSVVAALVAGCAVAALTALMSLRWIEPLSAVAAGLVMVVATVTAGLAGGDLLGVDIRTTTAVLVVLLGLLALTRASIPADSGRTAGADPGGELVVRAFEVAALLVALTLGTVVATTNARPSVWLAAYLTLIGVAAAILGLVRPDRREIAYLGAGLLVIASWVRLYDLGVEDPEPYTLPSALFLLGIGLLTMYRRPEVSSWRALSAGLGLALVPSLLWVLLDPSSWRAVILGAGCLGLVLGGALLRWGAVLAWGTVVGATVVLWEAGPFLSGAIPRWALIGAAGALLVGLGLTWEARSRDLRRASASLLAMR